MALPKKVRTGCRGGTPGWGRSPTPLYPIVLTCLRKAIKAAIEEAEAATNLSEISNVKKLKAEKSSYRIRVGNYRIGFVMSEDMITFVRVLHRKEMYRYFP